MKCPYCQKEVPPGTLYCPECLTEVPWVKEYDTVEQQIQKRKRENLSSSKKTAPRKSGMQRVRTWLKKWRHSLRDLFVHIWIQIVVILAVLLIILLFYRQNTHSSLFREAQKSFASRDYDLALTYLTRAIDKKPYDYETNLLLVQTEMALEDYESARLLLKPLLQQYTSDSEVYLLMAQTLFYLSDMQALQDLFASVSDEQIREVCKDYIVLSPDINISGGTYAKEITIELSGEYEQIYYTLSGAVSTNGVSEYSGPVLLTKGITHLSAYGVNSLGITSNMIEEKYVISVGQPDPPLVYPASGTFQEDTRITIQVPEGYRAYYAFDEIPTTASSLYERPISMPLDSHEFFAILVSADGQVSEPTRREYYLEY